MFTVHYMTGRPQDAKTYYFASPHDAAQWSGDVSLIKQKIAAANEDFDWAERRDVYVQWIAFVELFRTDFGDDRVPLDVQQSFLQVAAELRPQVTIRTWGSVQGVKENPHP